MRLLTLMLLFSASAAAADSRWSFLEEDAREVRAISEEAVQRAAAHQTTFGHGHRWALQGEAPTTLSPPVSPTGSRASVRSRSLNSR